MIRQPTVRIHVCEAKHGNSKFIGCMDHLENTWKQLNLMLTGWQQHYETTLEQDYNKLQELNIANKGME